MKSLIRKYRADRLLRDLELDYLVKVKTYTKNLSSVQYQMHNGDSLVVTLDPTFCDVMGAYGLVRSVYKSKMETEFETTLDLNEVDEMEYGANYLFPLYVFEVEPVKSIPTGHKWHGALKSQCAYAMALWRDTDIRTLDIRPEFGTILAERADMFWHEVINNNQLSLLHQLARFCRQSGAGMYIPMLSAANFAMRKGDLIPYTAVCSLEVYGAVTGRVLYPERREL